MGHYRDLNALALTPELLAENATGHKCVKPSSNSGVRINWANPITRKLVGAWLLNDRGGATARDLLGKNHGAISGATWTPYGLEFAESDTNDVGLGTSSEWEGHHSGAIFARIKPDDFSSSGAVFCRDPAHSGRGQSFYINSSGNVAWSARFASTTYTASTTAALTAGRWSNVAVSCAGQSADYHFLVNGKIETATLNTSVDGWWTDEPDSVSAYEIGHHKRGDSSHYFDGVIGFVYLFGADTDNLGNLTDAELLSLDKDPYQLLMIEPTFWMPQAAAGGGTSINATSASRTNTANNATVQADVDINISATSASRTNTANNATVQADVDINISATSVSRTNTANNAVVSSGTDTNIAATSASRTNTANNATVQADVDINITATSISRTNTANNAVVSLGTPTNISATSVSRTNTANNATVDAQIDINITATNATRTITPLNASVQADIDINITATSVSRTNAANNAVVFLGNNIIALNVARTNTAYNATVDAQVDVNVAATYVSRGNTALAAAISYYVPGYTIICPDSDSWSAVTKDSSSWTEISVDSNEGNVTDNC